MNYDKIYKELILKAKERYIQQEKYYEGHHIIPKCMGGDDNLNNIVKLTVKEHYVAHHLLVKIYENTEYYSKLICAFRYMTVDSHNGNRLNLKDYENMRKLFGKYHPMKDKNISNKVSKKLKIYYSNLTIEERLERLLNYIRKNKKITEEEKNKKIEKYIERYKTGEFQKSHIKKEISKEEREKKRKEGYKKVSETMKKYISNLSEKEKIDRLKKSFWKCDHKKRGESISKSKSGKKTKQQEIMGIRYASMSDEDFYNFIKNKIDIIKKRMINLRERYLNKK